MKRPTSLSIIGWLAIALGALSVLSGLFGLAMSSVMPELTEPHSEFRPDSHPAFLLHTYVFEYYRVLVGIQLLVAALAILAGIGLLKLKRWARIMTEVFSWLWIVYTFLFVVFWVWFNIEMMGEIPEDTGPMVAIPVIMIVFGVVTSITFCIPAVVVIRVLRGEAVQSAIASAATPDATDGDIVHLNSPEHR